MTTTERLREVSENFQIHGVFQAAEPYGNGHINDTYLSLFDQGGNAVRYIHQRLNRTIFKDPESLMDNVRRVTEHLRAKLDGEPDAARQTLALIPARDGRVFYRDSQGDYWRTYLFIERAKTYEVVETPQQAFEAAQTFGRFQRLLADLPPPRLHETIPNFHNTPMRMAALEQAVAADAVGRVDRARAEIEFVRSREPLAHVLLDLHRHGAIPERTTHNDTKLNNVMLDDATHRGLCAIDLDTVMPGLALYDFGDMVRTATSPVAEDELDLSKVHMRMTMYEALVRGYLAATGSMLNEAERDHLAFSGKLITLQIGLRFLTDYLSGDVYFKTHRPDHNLQRCRAQFKLVESIEQQEPQMNLLAREA